MKLPSWFYVYSKNNQRGVFALDDISPNEELLFVPRDVLLRFDKIKDSLIGKTILKEFGDSK